MYWLIGLIQIALWIYLYRQGTKIADARGYRRGKNDGFKEAIELANAGFKKEIDRFLLNHDALPGVPLKITRHQDEQIRYHSVSMSFAGVHVESMLPSEWEKLPKDKRKQMITFVRKEMAKDLIQAVINTNGR